jgi:phage gpG-like protein
MAGVGVEVKLDEQYQVILDALRKASAPDLKGVAGFAGAKLKEVSAGAFKNESDPVTGAKWPSLKYPRANGKTHPILRDGFHLRRSLHWQEFGDGSVLFGSNVVYSRIHQEGGKTGAHEIRPRHKKALRFNGRYAAKAQHPGSEIPARPYMGVPKDFDRTVLTDPAILKLLGIAP